MTKFFLILLVLSTSVYSSESVFGKVFFIKGEAILDRPGDVRPLKKGDTLLNQDIVKAKEKSIVIISFGEGMKSKMKITENTQILLQQKKNEKSKKISLAVGVGNVVVDFFNKDKQVPTTLKLETANASLGVRGTRFFVLSEKSGDFATSVENGTVEVFSKRSEDNTVVLDQGKGTMLNEKKEVIQSQKFDWHDKVNWKVDPNKGELSHSEAFFNGVRQSFKKYRKHVAARVKKRKEKIQNKMQKMRQQRLKKRQMLLRKRKQKN